MKLLILNFQECFASAVRPIGAKCSISQKPWLILHYVLEAFTILKPKNPTSKVYVMENIREHITKYAQ